MYDLRDVSRRLMNTNVPAGAKWMTLVLASRLNAQEAGQRIRMSEHELASATGISNITARNYLQMLRAEGVVQTVYGHRNRHVIVMPATASPVPARPITSRQAGTLADFERRTRAISELAL